jgi:diguanylate cyclase (GGDEF)-like protein/PAS domain S-box-containing protein
MLNIPLSLRLTTGLVILMIGALLWGEAYGFHLDHLAGMITATTILGIAIGLFIISSSHNRIDLAVIAPTLLKHTLDALGEGIVLIDHRERIIIANTAFADIVGKTPQSLKRTSISSLGWEFVNDYDHEFPWTTSIRDGSQLRERQMYHVGHDGRKKLFVIDSAPARDTRGKRSGVMITFDDITSREAKNCQLEDMLGMLKKSRDEIRRQNEVLQELATRDSLTNCLNRRSFFEKYQTVFRAAVRDEHPLACIMTDIDMFKSINDRYGHSRGDEVICKVAEVLHHSLRSTDTVCRYGGEEFCIILPGIDMERALEMSERARENIAQLALTDETENTCISITSSFGVASIEHQPESLARLIERADNALYHSKYSGRNCVTQWLPEQTGRSNPAGSNRNNKVPSAGTGTERSYTYGIGNTYDFDALTGLPNRNEFHNSIVSAVQSCKVDNLYASVIMLDLDMFNRINSTLGYAFGDELLKVVSRRIVDALRSTDTVARLYDDAAVTTIYRLGGDEFGVLLTGLDCTEFTGQITNRLIDAITQQIDVQGQEIHLGCSAGISLYPDDGISADTLLKNASTALYHAKLSDQNRFQFYNEDLNRNSLKSLRLENDLRHALERNELELYYQPKIDLASGRINSVEALLRWRHPEFGMIPPGEFIPVAEQTGLIMSLGYWVLDTACRQVCLWQKAGFEQLTVAVNLSAVQFRQHDLLEKIHDILGKSGICAHHLELEITESTVMEDIDAASSTMRALHHSGIRISIDDFGTGYSSLSHLKRFPINTIKIDRSFIRDITTDSDDAAIVTAIIAMAHDMGLKTIAEGVESKEQLDFLKSMKCEEVQGFLFSPPVPASDTFALLGQPVKVLQQLSVSRLHTDATTEPASQH